VGQLNAPALTVTSTVAPQRIGYRPALDGLRALSVLAVVVLHAWPSALPGGWVEVFFVLSGYLITTVLLAEHDRTGRRGGVPLPRAALSPAQASRRESSAGRGPCFNLAGGLSG